MTEALDTSQLAAATIATPLGATLAVARDDVLLALEFVDDDAAEAQRVRIARRLRGEIVSGANTILEATRRELDSYFAGALREFTIPVHAIGTEFQMAVWQALRGVGYGTTTTYGALARRVKRPRAVRAVGAANGDNPIAIVLPCHRVIGSDGRLTGYGGGLWRKRALLALEGVQLDAFAVSPEGPAGAR